jgi:hypothetical protein
MTQTDKENTKGKRGEKRREEVERAFLPPLFSFLFYLLPFLPPFFYTLFFFFLLWGLL